MFSFTSRKLFSDCVLRYFRYDYHTTTAYFSINIPKCVAQNCVAFQKIVLKTFKAPQCKNILYPGSINNCIYHRYFSGKINKENTNDSPKEFSENEDMSSSKEYDDNFYAVDEQEITGGDPELIKRLKLCMLEVETFKQDGHDVPSFLKSSHWKELLVINSRTSRLKYLRYLCVTEARKVNDKLRKERKRLERLEEVIKMEEWSNPDHIRYGLGGNTIFNRVSESTINFMYNNNLVIAMKFGQDIVIDCSYDKYMTKREQNYTAKQFLLTFANNRFIDEPFNLHFTGVNKDSQLIQRFKLLLPTIFDWEFPINLTEKSYLDCFPKEKLVYLTPHCRNELKSFSHDDIYIIGGIVDKVNQEPLSLAKAKSEGIRMAKFPLDRYLSWNCGSKSLTIDQCVNILHELKKSGNWEKALQHVPKRKLTPNENKVIEAEADIIDKSMNFSQPIRAHEWGVVSAANKRRMRKPIENDLRIIVSKIKQKSGGDNK